jgi:CDP-diacylglycerol--serine O-phosphatidyltransferase
MRQIPNVFTLLNLFFGCLAIVFILQTGEGIVNRDGEEWKVYLPERIWWGSICIGIAAVVDFLDGFLARLLKSSSEMGKQLDSLSDVVSFGVAPGMILFQLLRIVFAGRPDGLDVSIAWLLPAFLLPMAAAWRLARFNIDPGQAYGFRGMPTPAVGLLVASLPMAVLNAGSGVQEWLLNEWVLYALIAGLCWLMVSSLPLMGLKFKDYGFRSNLPKWILVAVALAAGLWLQWLAVPLVFLAYIALSLAFQSRQTS